MNWDQMLGRWDQFKAEIQDEWGALTDDDLDAIQGRREELVGRIRDRYGLTPEKAERDVRQWERSVMV